MARYHVSPSTGEPKACKATVKACPFGSEERHYATKEAARAAYEMEQLDFLLTGLKKANQDAIDEKWAAIYDPSSPVARPLKFRDYLSEEEVASINVDGVTCPSCGQAVEPWQAARVLNEQDNTYCRGCGEEIGLYEISITVGVTKDTHPAFDASNVSKMTWYHSSTAEDWDAQLETNGGFYAHLGSRQASLDRQVAELYSAPTSTVDEFYLYELSVDEDSKIAKSIDVESNEDYGMYDPQANPLRLTPKPGEEPEGPLDVLRYINKWEDMASISLVASTRKLKVLKRTKVSKKEALSSLSLYNVDPKLTDYLEQKLEEELTQDEKEVSA